jgi:putative two-component system response regulator
MKKIMLVDDEPDQIKSIQISIKHKFGDEFYIIPANSGEECLELLRDNNIPDLILLDIMMPTMSGWEVFNKIKENDKWSHIPIVFLTARNDEMAKNAGGFLADDFINKPVEIWELKDRIDKFLK